MDRFGINLDTTFEARADTLVEMCRRGYAERIVLSQDATCYIDWLAPGVMDLLPQWNYTHIHDDVLPYVREHGVGDEQIETMLVANPRRYFENAGVYGSRGVLTPGCPGGALSQPPGGRGRGGSADGA